MFSFDVVGLVFFSVSSPEIGLEKYLQNDQFCVDWDVKP